MKISDEDLQQKMRDLVKEFKENSCNWQANTRNGGWVQIEDGITWSVKRVLSGFVWGVIRRKPEPKLIPHTFISACRAIAEHGEVLVEATGRRFEVQGMDSEYISVTGKGFVSTEVCDYHDEYLMTWQHEDGTPFAQVVKDEG